MIMMGGYEQKRNPCTSHSYCYETVNETSPLMRVCRVQHSCGQPTSQWARADFCGRQAKCNLHAVVFILGNFLPLLCTISCNISSAGSRQADPALVQLIQSSNHNHDLWLMTVTVCKNTCFFVPLGAVVTARMAASSHVPLSIFRPITSTQAHHIKLV